MYGDNGELYIGKGDPLTVREWRYLSELGRVVEIEVYGPELAERAAAGGEISFNVYDQHLNGWHGVGRFEHPPQPGEATVRVRASRIDRSHD